MKFSEAAVKRRGLSVRGEHSARRSHVWVVASAALAVATLGLVVPLGLSAPSVFAASPEAPVARVAKGAPARPTAELQRKLFREGNRYARGWRPGSWAGPQYSDDKSPLPVAAVRSTGRDVARPFKRNYIGGASWISMLGRRQPVYLLQMKGTFHATSYICIDPCPTLSFDELPTASALQVVYLPAWNRFIAYESSATALKLRRLGTPFTIRHE